MKVEIDINPRKLAQELYQAARTLELPDWHHASITHKNIYIRMAQNWIKTKLASNEMFSERGAPSNEPSSNRERE